MTEEPQDRQVGHNRLWLALALAVILLAALIVPPMVSISRYKSRITQLVSNSLGRPVRLASVELRLVPRPGFVLTDLTVDEDPAYGSEPVLHATTVTVSIRLLSLWRGRLEIDSISVDDASLNIVRTSQGRWNLDSLFHTATTENQNQAATGPSGATVPLPFLEATHSRINFKNGEEKLPFSLVETEFSLRRENPGEWRITLRGQPARTDLSLEQADTGEVRLSATLHSAAHLREMPVNLDLEWKNAQLGQLTRLALGSDSGWRGDLTGELHMDGTADAARIQTRLKAIGVHRAEFAPAAPLDFDANCGLEYHFTSRSVQGLLCDSPLGNGRLRLAGDFPGSSQAPHFSVELDRLPVAAVLDALRTVRSNLAPGLEAKGWISGKVTCDERIPVAAPQQTTVQSGKNAHWIAGKNHPVSTKAAYHSPLAGSFSVDGLELNGGGLTSAILIPKLSLDPVATPETQSADGSVSPDSTRALSATMVFPAGGATPLTVTAQASLANYQLTARGQASVARARELALVVGLREASALESLAGAPVTIDLSAHGPWIPAETAAFSAAPNAVSLAQSAALAAPALSQKADRLTGTVSFHDANWKAAYLANHLEISQATLHLNDGELRWDPVVFTYGPVKGTASLTVPSECALTQPCLPHFEVNFGALDAASLQAAILGAQVKSTVLSTLIARLHPSTTPSWPQLEGTVKADSLLLGPVTLREATATVRILENGAHMTALDASLLGGRIHASGSLYLPTNDQSKPAYMFEGHMEKLSPAAVGQLVGQHWSGGSMDASGKMEASGFAARDLAASAKGTLHFDWQHGTVAGTVPDALARFDRWIADAAITDGTIALQQNQVTRGRQSASVEAIATLGTTNKLSFPALREVKKAPAHAQ